MTPNFVRAMADIVCRMFVGNPFIKGKAFTYMYDIAMALYSYADFVEYTCATGPQNIYIDELLEEVLWTLDNDPALSHV